MASNKSVRLGAATSGDSEMANGNGHAQAITAPGSVTLFDASHTLVGTFATIQAAVNAAADNYTVEVGAGTYVEQVIVNNIDGLTIVASAGAMVTIQAPADVVQTGTKASGQGVEAVVTVLNSAGVTIDNIDVDGHGAGNTVTSGNDFVGVFYRNSSGSLLTIDVAGIRDPYENGTTAGGHPIISGIQRGQGVLVSNDNGPHLAFTMTGGSITDFQKTGINIRNADLDISGVTITGGGAQTINAQNGIQVQLSTGTIDGNTISGIGYAGAQDVYSAGMLLFANTGLDVTGNSVTGSNGESTAGKVIGIGIFDFGIPTSGGEISGNSLSFVDLGISADGAITPDAVAIHDNVVTNLDTTDPFADGVSFTPDPALAIAFDVEGTGVQDTLSGAAGNDILTGLGGNDEFQGNGGDDALHGDAGADQADYAGNFADYTIVAETDGGGHVVGFLAVTDNNAGNGDEGADTLSSIETLKFADIVLNLADPVRLFDAGNNLVGTFATIQAAVNAAADDYTIEVAAGTYVEQVVVDHLDGLTIMAAPGAAVTIQAPADLVETARSSSDREIHGVLTVKDSAGVTIDNIDIDGHGAGNTVDEGGGAGQANFYGIFYRNSSGTLLGVDIKGVRDPYPGGNAAGGEPLVSGVQRGVGLVVDNDTLMAFTMTGGSISDFQKNATSFNRVDLDISGVTVTGGGAQTGIAQNGFQVANSTGSIAGNIITGIGYAGPADAYSGAILAFGNTGLDIVNNVITGSNDDSLAAKVVGIYIFQSAGANSGGEISGNIISYVDIGIGIYNDVTPSGILIQNNAVSNVDTTDPFAAGIDFEPTTSLATPYDVDGSAAADILTGAAGNDVLAGLGGIDLLTGNGGDDSLNGGAGADRMDGGAGNDTYFVDNAGDQIVEAVGGGAHDYAVASASYALAAGVEVELISTGSNAGTAAINLTGNEFANILVGNAGANVLDGGSGGADTLVGLGGNDTYFIDADDRVFEAAGGGSDYVVTRASYALEAGASIELMSTSSNAGTASINLTGNELGQALVGNAGANLLDGGSGGADTLVGLGGNDTYYVDADDRVFEDAGGGSDYVVARASFALEAGASVELMSTSNNAGTAAINLSGNELANILVGNAGANLLNGGSGGADILVGLGGNDTYFVDTDDRVFEDAGGGFDYVAARASFALEAGASVELMSTSNNAGTASINLTGNELSQVLVGNAGANWLDAGSGGADTLQGLGGNDTYFVDANDQVLEDAGGGFDYVVARASYTLAAGLSVELMSTDNNAGTAAIDLTGNELANILVGNAGANLLNGLLGADTLQGLGGADIFAFTTAVGGGNVDAIVDFAHGTDKIALDDAIFDQLVPGALNPSLFHLGATATDEDQRILYDQATGNLYYDSDGNGTGAAVLFATLQNLPVLTASDFTVI